MERDQRLPPQPQVDEEDASLIHFTFQLLNMLRIILLISLGSLVYIGAKASPVLKTSPHPFSAKSDRTWLWGWAWGAESTVSVVDRSPVVSWPSRPAAFGAELADPLLGYVIPLSSFTEPCGDSESQKSDGEGSNWGCPKLCVKGPHQPEPTETWIALVQRGECEFVSKIREAQRLGAKAVVVGGSDPDISGWPDTLVNMYSTDASDVKIASTFIKFAAYKELTSLISTSNTSHSGLRTLSLLITAEYSAWEWYSPVITFVIILLLPSVLTFITLLIHRVRAARAAQLDRAPENIVRHLPWRVWTGTGWEKHEGSEDASASPDTHGPESAATSPNVEPVPNMSNEEAEAAVEASTSTPLQVEQPWFEQQTECAICLSQFEKGDKVRVLPCHHIFHLDEVDEWLIQRKKLCPVCKADVTQPHPVLPTTTPTSASTPTPSNSTDHDPPTERTPLLSNQS